MCSGGIWRSWNGCLRSGRGAVRLTPGDEAGAFFIELVRQAADLDQHPRRLPRPCTATNHMSARDIRDESRRKRRGREAGPIQEINLPADPEADQLQAAHVAVRDGDRAVTG